MYLIDEEKKIYILFTKKFLISTFQFFKLFKDNF
jgi:hypothetical protein